MYLPFSHICPALGSCVSKLQIIRYSPLLKLWVIGSTHMDNKPSKCPSCLSHHCTSFSFVNILYKAFRVPCRQRTHPPLTEGDKYLPCYLCLLLTLIVLLVRIRFPNKNIKVVIKRHVERTSIGMAKWVKERRKEKIQDDKGLRSGNWPDPAADWQILY